MTTEDITLNTDASFLLIPTLTRMSIYNGSGRNIKYRFGALSTSSGATMKAGNTLIVEEDIYLATSTPFTNSTVVQVSK